MLRSHFLNMALFSVLVALFFAFLTQTTRRDRIRVAPVLCLSMVGIALVIAYIMFPFPLK
ncbi:MAG: hypothetical protein HY509_05710 [Acidobacteria bacterium]|nr:hypothetical protein [Acidobacteriota bacterium]